jgi:hypothetical protein
MSGLNDEEQKAWLGTIEAAVAAGINPAKKSDELNEKPALTVQNAQARQGRIRDENRPLECRQAD